MGQHRTRGVKIQRWKFFTQNLFTIVFEQESNHAHFFQNDIRMALNLGTVVRLKFWNLQPISTEALSRRAVPNSPAPCATHRDAERERAAPEWVFIEPRIYVYGCHVGMDLWWTCYNSWMGETKPIYNSLG